MSNAETVTTYPMTPPDRSVFSPEHIDNKTHNTVVTPKKQPLPTLRRKR